MENVKLDYLELAKQLIQEKAEKIKALQEQKKNLEVVVDRVTKEETKNDNK